MNNLPTIYLDAGVHGALTANANVDVTHLAPITVMPLTVDANVDIKHLPNIHLDPIHLALDTPIRLGLEPVRCHVPINMAIGFSLFGKDLACIRFFGETQFIAEPYKPNPCECCSSPKEK